MIIVGLSGSIGSGKTTFARFLGQNFDSWQHWESWQLIAEVANALRAQPLTSPAPDNLDDVNVWLAALPGILQRTTHTQANPGVVSLSPDKLRAAPENYDKLLEYLAVVQASPELQAGDIDEINKETFRSILQWLGGYLVKVVGAGIWYDEILRRIKAQPKLELATIGGVRFPGDGRRIQAVGGKVLEIRRPQLAAQDAQDLTERERSLIIIDSTIHNDGTLTELQQCATRVIADLNAGKLEASYSALNA